MQLTRLSLSPIILILSLGPAKPLEACCVFHDCDCSETLLFPDNKDPFDFYDVPKDPVLTTMHPAFQSQVDAAIRSVEQELRESEKMPDSSGTKIDFGRGQTTAKISGDSIVSTEITTRAAEGPSLKAPEVASPIGPKSDPRYSGKAGR